MRVRWKSSWILNAIRSKQTEKFCKMRLRSRKWQWVLPSDRDDRLETADVERIQCDTEEPTPSLPRALFLFLPLLSIFSSLCHAAKALFRLARRFFLRATSIPRIEGINSILAHFLISYIFFFIYVKLILFIKN